MTVQNLTQRKPARFLGWHHSETLAASATSDPVAIPPLLAGQRISVRTIAGTNDAKVQSTISSDAKVAAGTAVWDDWPPGAQVGTVSANLDAPVTGIRCVVGSTSADTVLFEVLV